MGRNFNAMRHLTLSKKKSEPMKPLPATRAESDALFDALTPQMGRRRANGASHR